MILDRSLAPEFKVPEDFVLTPPECTTLSSGAKVFHISTPNLEAIKIEVISKGQRASLPLEQTLVPSFTLQMLQEGTVSKSAEEIADFLDFHASEIGMISTFSHEGLSLLTTRKHIFKVLPLLIEIINQPAFPVEILEKRKSQRKLSIRLEMEKTASRASQLFRKTLFGPAHPYGVEIQEKHVEIIERELLETYYQNKLWQETEFFVTGNFSSEEFRNLELILENIPFRKPEASFPTPAFVTGESIIEPREKALQSSIRIGGFSIPKDHPDFIALSVFNTILGGYFGSRLIKNIREDKGHTYGIYSSLAEIGTANYWVVNADVQKVHFQEVINEVYKEIEKLCTYPLDSEEIETVRNYQIGQMLNRFSSSFELMDRFRAVYHSGMDLDFYTRKLDFLKTFTQENILKTGQVFFSNPPFTEVVVG
ncbi:pitrilysin family protein [Algoriphagus sp. CAU 1675]|uniref:M16 family metallopeptidase n=1 Tax=Algoriphagus sp. CAU 1675 TaxID=3032597 RepID=UPI0023DC86D0|nr:pitrilysin family protein [Algoriphagus sp. CAU 1675]MDF2157149.1 pitrilysin family protein [Algoriphagus sp. CAU 1675]